MTSGLVSDIPRMSLHFPGAKCSPCAGQKMTRVAMDAICYICWCNFRAEKTIDFRGWWYWPTPFCAFLPENMAKIWVKTLVSRSSEPGNIVPRKIRLVRFEYVWIPVRVAWSAGQYICKKIKHELLRERERAVHSEKSERCLCDRLLGPWALIHDIVNQLGKESTKQLSIELFYIWYVYPHCIRSHSIILS